MQLYLNLMAALALSICGLLPAVSRADLQTFVRKPESAFQWRLMTTTNVEQSGDRTYDLSFVSQTWQGGAWRHDLQVYQPQHVAPAATLFLWVTGGSPRAESLRLGMDLARRMGAPVAFLYDIPNQPLLEGKLYEDDLIAETFVRYLKTGDESWPLLFPMVKSVVKAMDVLQDFGRRSWGERIDKFIVAGASKRGWTTWLTAAVDPRVRAIAPVVIDVLNMRAQMRRQVETLGAYSVRLAPYSSRGLLPIPATPAGERLLNMVDPWAYRDELTMPKLIINGTNDFYWATDALNVYWSSIPGDNRVLYVPNAGHNLRRLDRPPAEQLNHFVSGLAAFGRHQISGVPLPRISWDRESSNGKLRLVISAKPAPLGGRLWLAHGATADFRSATWSEREARLVDGRITAEVTPPEKGRAAFFGELDYDIGGLRYHLSTQMMAD